MLGNLMPFDLGDPDYDNDVLSATANLLSDDCWETAINRGGVSGFWDVVYAELQPPVRAGWIQDSSLDPSGDVLAARRIRFSSRPQAT